VNFDFCSVARRGIQGETGMDLIGSLPHASQAEMPRRRWQTRVKTTSIVFEFQGNASFGVGQKTMHAGSFAMAERVVQCLAGYPEKMVLRRRAQDAGFALH
jgi:hypothetical protein